MEWGPEEIRNKLPRVLSQEGHRICLIPSIMSCDNTWNVTYQGSSLETQCQSFLLGLSHVSTLCPTPKFQTSIRKAGVVYKPYCLHKKLRYNEIHLSFREWWESSQKSKFPNASQVPALQAGFSKDSSLRHTILTLFCTHIHLLSSFQHLLLYPFPFYSHLWVYIF